jgi:hypothetical protein
MTVFNALVLRWRSKLGDPERRLAFNVGHDVLLADRSAPQRGCPKLIKRLPRCA